MKKLSKGVFILAILAFLTAGCKKQLEIDPVQSIPSETALQTPENIDAAITGLYARLKNLRQYGRDLITHPEALADNGYATNASGRLLNESNNVLNAHFTGTIWSNSYSAINQINLILEAIPRLNVVPAPTTARINSWRGQCLYLRGLYYFDLVRVYAYIPGAIIDQQNRGGVPIILKGIDNIDSAVALLPERAPINDVYSRIVADLTDAEGLLGFGPTADVALANKAAARLLLARVNLYRRDYAAAKKWADDAIALAGDRMTDISNYEAQWRAATNREILFQVRFAQNNENPGVNESLQTSFTTLTAPGNQAVLGGFGDLVPRPSLLADLGITLTSSNFVGVNASISSRSTDVRNRLFEPGNGGRTKVWVECTKYIGKNGFINLDNVPVLRIAEAYLIRAESAATPGSAVFSETNALNDLKFLKQRRYEGYIGSAIETTDNGLSGNALLEEIIRQRRIEFAFEGHRFFDLKRLGRDIVKTAPSTATVSFSDARILPPIPQREVDGNPRIKQNFGY
ncbi:RagB/SusD family nutrient uptake outer membrane protein [Phnomibacter ginsenosidimutans]|uniref:RagB/SusD family nutrient uptake outer membrane protein n=1 Tax=Phnomibacter ginsenosidimutans TaxID=2676868 RepID=A0A6I6H5J8_9BACT|nr:RagB/SusD family nutrient uptake outer membrane protein [Phnomibacter ginsenosidimutans]QGW29591.1 RagB/SusD family nutrient uptake outer membrane protein [Phnomibacter ginsenosidimutans]